MLPMVSKTSTKMASKPKKPIDLFEDLKTQLKSPQGTLPPIVSNLSKLLILKKEPLLPLMKTLLNPYFKESLLVASTQDLKLLFEPFLIYCEDNPKDDLTMTSFLKLLSKVRFQSFPNCEVTFFPYLKFLEAQGENVSPKNCPLNNTQITLLRLIFTAFMNMASKIPEFKDPRSTNLLHNFYTETHNLFFKVPVDIRLQQDFFLKFLMSLFRLLGYFLEKIPDLEKDQKVLETILMNLYKFMFLGTVFQKPIFGDLKEVSVLFTESNSISSSSEFSDLEALKAQGNDKLDELYSKLRNYAALALQNLIKLNQKALAVHWNKLFFTAVPVKEFQDFIRIHSVFMVFDNVSERKRLMSLVYKEPSVLFLLINEKIAKVRINILNLIIQIVECLPIKQWLAGFSSEKIEKNREKMDTFLPVSYQIFSSMRNVHWTISALMLLEVDCQVLCHILKILAMFINSYCYEKFNEELKGLLFENYLFPILTMSQENKSLTGFQEFKLALQANSLACISNLLSLSSALVKIEEKYLRNNDKNLNIITITLKNLDLLIMKQGKETDKILLIIESLNFFSKIQRNHHTSFLVFLEPLIQISEHFDTTQSSLPKDLSLRIYLCFSRLFEEITKAANPIKTSNEEEFDDDPSDANKIVVPPQNPQILPIEFIKFLWKKVLQGLLSDNLELIISALSIFSNLQIQSFENPHNTVLEFLSILEKLLSKNVSIKTAVFRTLGCLSEQKICQKAFASQILKILVSGAQGLQNVNAKIKNSWALASWLCCDELFMTSNEQKIDLKPIFEHIKELCLDNKEKVVCNGLRALGYFFKNIDQEDFYKTFNEQTIEEVETIIKKRLNESSIKIGLNACVALRTISHSLIKELIFSLFSNVEIYQRLLKVMTGSISLKNQIHALRTLAVIKEKTIIAKTFRETIGILTEVLRKLETSEEINPHYEDYRSQDTMKSLVLELVLCRILEDCDDDFLMETFLMNSNEKIPIFDLVNQMVHEIIKEKSIGFKGFDEKLEEEKIMTQGKVNKGVIDEIPVKGEETLTLVRLDFNEKNQKELRKKLMILKRVCQKMCQLIDLREKVAISFIFYDTMKEYSELELNKTIDFLEMKVVKQGFFIDK